MFRVDIEGKRLQELTPKKFAELGLRERFDIQEWIEKAPQILGEDLMIIGKEVILPSGKRLDLLAIDKAGSVVVIELKRDDSGDAVEWQAIKYASYCANWLPEEIYRQVSVYLEVSEPEARQAIEQFLDTDLEDLNKSQRIILASRQFNSEVASAVFWLREQGLDIQCTRLAPFVDQEGNLFLTPDTIIPLPEARDYIERKEKKQQLVAKEHRPWTGYWFVNVGECEYRNWEDNQHFGYIGAGHGAWYSRALKRLSVGDRIYAYIKNHGYVGFGEVEHEAVMIKDFREAYTGQRILEQDLIAPNAADNCEDEEFAEYAVGVKWIKTFPKVEAKTFSGAFANQNVVCKLRDPSTLEFLHKTFGK